MSLVSMACNECGAPLSVPATTKFLNCGHCGAQLKVQRNESASYTEALDELSSSNERIEHSGQRIEEDIAELKRKANVAEVDRLWALERERHYVNGKHGHRSIPTQGGAIAGGVVVAFMGGFLLIASSASDLPPILGVLLIAIGLVGVWFYYNKASAYLSAKARYKKRRRQARKA